MARSKARKMADILSASSVLDDGVITAAEVVGLHALASTGSYTDLINVPSLLSQAQLDDVEALALAGI
jgi:hypothetical protein|tara:strand:+ start:244 stop:447 length:204 start_codon:yes stop_codon:yes gene_type:complete